MFEISKVDYSPNLIRCISLEVIPDSTSDRGADGYESDRSHDTSAALSAFELFHEMTEGQPFKSERLRLWLMGR